MSRRKKSQDNGYNVWRSYSDMMAGILLLFVLIMCVAMAQSQKNYEERIREQDEFAAELLAKQNQLDQQETELAAQTEELLSKDELVASQKHTLAEQAKELERQRKALEEMQETLNIQADTLDAQQKDIDDKQKLIDDQQAQIEKIIGVKADVVEALQKEFTANSMNVTIDPQTGALVLDANVLFSLNEYELTEEGKYTLEQVLPIYCRVLLSEKYADSLAEIIVDGYTDSLGDYASNLLLSQNRAAMVALYMVQDIRYSSLSEEEGDRLESFLSVNGHSYNNLVYDANGEEDPDASRRVEVKFRLKDEEMITELDEIMRRE